MEKYIKYKRITEKFELNDKWEYKTQKFFDKLISDGFEIIYYSETEEKVINEIPILHVVIVVGKKQNNIL